MAEICAQSHIDGSSVAPARTPMVSIGMPLYNAAPWLEGTIRSVLAQTLSDFELILCDNASTDGSKAICERLAAEDPRIRYHRHERNIGANRNYQSTLDLAVGRYFKWASSSDLCAPTLLADCVAALESRPDAVLALGRTALFSESMDDGRLYGNDIALLSDDPKERFVELFSRMQLNNAFNGLIRREAIRAVMPLATFEAADIVLMAELALRGKFLLLDKPHFYRRMTPETATKLKSIQEAQRHMEPAAKKPLLWQNWRFYFQLLRAAMNSTRFGTERFRVLGYAMRQAIWARRELVDDVIQAVRRVV